MRQQSTFPGSANMRPGKLIFVSHRSKHHAATSGYTPIARYLPSFEATRAEPRMPYRLRKFISRFAEAPLYDSDSVTKEFRALRYMLAHTGVIHYMNGERDPFLTLHAADLMKWRTVATFHQPISSFAPALKKDNYLRHLDGLIAIGTNLVDFLKEQARHDRVAHIPLGVDTTYFTPGPGSTEDSRPMVMMVGVHQRDFELFGKVALSLHDIYPNLRIAAVTFRSAWKKLPNVDWLERYDGISDVALVEMYRSATCLLMPLREATANCAVLEALACGTPVVASEVGGIVDYLSPESGLLSQPGNADSMVDAARLLLEDPNLLQRMRVAARERAMDYEWTRVASQLLDFYRTVLGVDVA